MTCQNSFLKLNTTDGVCSECKFSRKVEADNQSEKSKYIKQLVIKNVKGTVVLFSSGSFRMMGCVDAIETSFLAFHYIDKIN